MTRFNTIEEMREWLAHGGRLKADDAEKPKVFVYPKYKGRMADHVNFNFEDENQFEELLKRMKSCTNENTVEVVVRAVIKTAKQAGKMLAAAEYNNEQKAAELIYGRWMELKEREKQ